MTAHLARRLARVLIVALFAVGMLPNAAQAQQELWANNGNSTLAVAIGTSDTSITVATGDGAKFPTISGTAGDYFYVTLEEGATLEVVKVTARSGDVLTVTRAQQSTSASAFTTGPPAAKVEHRLTSTSLSGLQTGRSITTNTAHNPEGDLQQPTGGPYGFSTQLSAPEIITVTGGATAQNIATNFVAVKFTTGTNTQLGYIVVPMKLSAGTAQGNNITGMLYTDSGGKPNTSITPSGTGSPAQFYLAALNTSTYTDANFLLNATVTASTSYWFVIQQTSVSGGQVQLQVATTAATGAYATDNVDAVSATPSGTANWTLVNNVTPNIKWFGDNYIAAYGYSANYSGVSGRSLNSWGGRFDSETGMGSYSKSRHDIGAGGASVYGIGVRGSSVWNIAGQFVSTNNFGEQASGTTGGSQVVCSAANCVALQAVPSASTSIAYQILDGSNAFTNTWQTTNKGLQQIYNGITLSGSGFPYIIGTTGLLSAQGANIGTTTIPGASSVAVGLYEVCAQIAVTRAATTSSTMPSVTVLYNNGVAQTFALTATSTGNATTTHAQSCIPVRAAAATALQYSTASFATSGGTSMQYELYVTARAIF